MAEQGPYLFDANAIVTAARSGRVDRLFGHHTLELGFFESTNVIWKLSAFRQEYTRDQGEDIVSLIQDLREEMNVLISDDLNLQAVYETAWDTGLTAYDASYIIGAYDTDAMLVTDDGGIHDQAPDDISLMGVSEVLE